MLLASLSVMADQRSAEGKAAWILVECSCLSGPKMKSTRNFLQLFLTCKQVRVGSLSGGSVSRSLSQNSNLVCRGLHKDFKVYGAGAGESRAEA